MLFLKMCCTVCQHQSDARTENMQFLSCKQASNAESSMHNVSEPLVGMKLKHSRLLLRMRCKPQALTPEPKTAIVPQHAAAG
jgi:hypothetical protein